MNATGTGHTSLFERGFTKGKDVANYFGARLAADQMVPVYEKLEQTNFVTLYGTTKPVEDFAEAFASYGYIVLLKRPQEIRIYREDMLLKTYHPCWEEARRAEKRKIIEELLKPGAR